MIESRKQVRATIRPGRLAPHEDANPDGSAGGRHRPHKACRQCGTGLFRDRSRRVGLCAVCAENQVCTQCEMSLAQIDAQGRAARLVDGKCLRCKAREYNEGRGRERAERRAAEFRAIECRVQNAE